MKCSIRPKISIIIPYYRGRTYLPEAVDSMRQQTLHDWELLIVVEVDHDAEDILSRFQQEDKRIRVLVNPGRRGIAASLNYGICQAKGDYIARMDADDISMPTRLEKQLSYMESHPECGVCGTWQRHFGPRRDWQHCPPVEHEDIRACLIFNCEMCHSTVMLRKSVLEEHGLFYDGSYAAEDYELWIRAIRVTQFHNLPEVLGEYRWNGENITQAKMDILSAESAQLVARNLKINLGISVSPAHLPYLNGWCNEIAAAAVDGFAAYRTILRQEHDLLSEIWQANQVQHVYKPEALLQVLTRRWKIVTGCTVYGQRMQTANSISQLLGATRFSFLFYLFARLKQLAKKMLRRN